MNHKGGNDTFDLIHSRNEASNNSNSSCPWNERSHSFLAGNIKGRSRALSYFACCGPPPAGQRETDDHNFEYIQQAVKIRCREGRDCMRCLTLSPLMVELKNDALLPTFISTRAIKPLVEYSICIFSSPSEITSSIASPAHPPVTSIVSQSAYPPVFYALLGNPTHETSIAPLVAQHADAIRTFVSDWIG